MTPIHFRNFTGFNVDRCMPKFTFTARRCHLRYPPNFKKLPFRKDINISAVFVFLQFDFHVLSLLWYPNQKQLF